MSHETSHLQALSESLRAQTSTGSSDSAEMSLADHAHSCRLTKKLQVRSGISGKLGALAQDAFKTLTAAQLPIVLDIIRSCTCSTMPEGVGELLHEAVNNSTERELCRLWSEDLDHIRAGTVRVLEPDQLRSRISAVKVCLRIMACTAQRVVCCSPGFESGNFRCADVARGPDALRAAAGCSDRVGGVLLRDYDPLLPPLHWTVLPRVEGQRGRCVRGACRGGSGGGFPGTASPGPAEKFWRFGRSESGTRNHREYHCGMHVRGGNRPAVYHRRAR